MRNRAPSQPDIRRIRRVLAARRQRRVLPWRAGRRNDACDDHARDPRKNLRHLTRRPLNAGVGSRSGPTSGQSRLRNSRLAQTVDRSAASVGRRTALHHRHPRRRPCDRRPSTRGTLARVGGLAVGDAVHGNSRGVQLTAPSRSSSNDGMRHPNLGFTFASSSAVTTRSRRQTH
jgi:hypothetical protein